MKRVRISTLMLLVVIAALLVAMIVQNHQAVLRERELQLQMERLTWEHEHQQSLNLTSVPTRDVKKTEHKKSGQK
jgi:hypothetical protein